MRLSPHERDRLLLFEAAELARRRRARGLLLNVPETIALIADEVAEAARDGLTLAEAIARGAALLGPADVLPGVADVVGEVQVEATFEDGSRLAIVRDPIGGGGLGDDAPGAVIPAATPLPDAADDPRAVRVAIENTASVPIGITSHYHVFEANPRLRFDRAAAYGMRVAYPAGGTLRLAPGETRDVVLVPIGGDRIAIGFAGLVDGPLDAPGARDAALARARATGYLGA